MSCLLTAEHDWARFDAKNRPAGNWTCRRCGKKRRTKNRALRRAVKKYLDHVPS